MIQELSTAEFIAGIRNDFYDENDIVKYCSTLSNIKAFWGALMVEHFRMLGKGRDPIVSFAPNATLQMDEGILENMTIEGKREFKRISDALFLVEDLMQKKTEPQPAAQEPRQGKATNKELPKELCTEAVKERLQKAVDGGLLDDRYQPTEKTKTKQQMAYLAELMGKPFGLGYKPFETLWNVKGLAKARYKSREVVGKVQGGEYIERVFK